MPDDFMQPDVPMVVTDEGRAILCPEQAPEMSPPLTALVKHCTDHYKACLDSAYRQAKIAAIKKSHEMYHLKPEYENWPFEGASNITLPFCQITVDNLEPRLVAGLLGKEPLVRFEAEGVGTLPEPQKAIQEGFNKELKNKVGIEASTRSMVHTLLMEGSYYCRAKYDLKRLLRQQYGTQQGADEMGQPVVTMAPQQIEDVQERGKIEQLSFSDVFVADNIDTEEKWQDEDKGVQRFYTYGELMRSKGKPGWKDEHIGPWLLTEKGRGTLSDDDQAPSQTVAGVEVTGRETIPCLEYHITYPIYRVEEKPENEQDDFREERIIVTFTRDSGRILRILKLTEMNMRNETIIRRVRLFAEPEKSYGYSVYEKLSSVQHGASDTWNNALNSSTVAMMPFFFTQKGAGLPSEIALIPGKGTEVDDVTKIVFPQFRVNPAALLQFFEVMVNLWERIGSIGDYQQGIQGAEKRTATEFLGIIQEGNIKHNYSANTLKDEYIAILRVLYDLYTQRQNDMQTYQAMQSVNKFVLTGSTDMANELIDRKTKEDLFGLLGNDPLMNPLKPREELLKSYKIPPGELGQWINPQAAQLMAMFVQDPQGITEIVQQYAIARQQAEQLEAEQGGNQRGNSGVPTKRDSGNGGVPGASIQRPKL